MDLADGNAPDDEIDAIVKKLKAFTVDDAHDSGLKDVTFELNAYDDDRGKDSWWHTFVYSYMIEADFIATPEGRSKYASDDAARRRGLTKTVEDFIKANGHPGKKIVLMDEPVIALSKPAGTARLVRIEYRIEWTVFDA